MSQVLFRKKNSSHSPAISEGGVRHKVCGGIGLPRLVLDYEQEISSRATSSGRLYPFIHVEISSFVRLSQHTPNYSATALKGSTTRNKRRYFSKQEQIMCWLHTFRGHVVIAASMVFMHGAVRMWPT